MKSRAFRVIGTLAALCALLVSCYWQSGARTGTISFSVGGSAGARYLAPYDDTLRVYLMADESVVRFGPAEHPFYDEVALAAGTTSTYTYTSPQIPAGIPYTVMVVAGESMSGEFLPYDHGIAGDVKVAQGSSTAVSLELAPTPYVFRSPDLWGQNVTGLAVYWDLPTQYVSTERSLRSFTFPMSESALVIDVPDAVINSLSVGEMFEGAAYLKAPWLNTSKGILPFDSWISNAFIPGYGSGAGVQNVFRSAALTDPVDSDRKYAVYLRDAGLGAAITTSYVPDSWVDVEFGGYQGGTRMYDLDSALGSMIATANFAYVATSTGALRIPTSAFVAGATAESIAAASRPLVVGDGSSRILTLDVVWDESGRDLLYLATAQGIYCGVLDELSDSGFLQPPVLVYQSTGARIRMVRGEYFADAADSSEHVILAAMDSRGVTIINHLTADIASSTIQSVTTLPFYGTLPCDIPSNLNQISWYDTGNELLLYIAGKKGFAYYSAAFYSSP